MTTVDHPSTPTLRDSANAPAPAIRAAAEEIERERRLTTSLVSQLAHAGLFRMAVPATLGGGAAYPARPVSVLHIHGTNDSVIPYAGGAEMTAFWRTHNGCAAEPVTSMVATLLDKQTFGACGHGTEVTLYTMKDGDHCWPGPPFCPPDDADRPFEPFSVIVDFLLAHPRDAGQPQQRRKA